MENYNTGKIIDNKYIEYPNHINDFLLNNDTTCAVLDLKCKSKNFKIHSNRKLQSTKVAKVHPLSPKIVCNANNEVTVTSISCG